MSKNILKLTGIAIALSLTGNAYAAYPERPITLVVPFAAGGPTDVVARTLGAELGKILNQPIVVENKTGAGGTVAANHIAQSKPDGYTYFLHHNGMSTAPALYKNLKYDPLSSFEYVGEVVDVPMTLLARADLPPNNMQEFIEYAKQNGENINLANAGPGAVSQLCGSLLQQALGVKFTTIPYQGTAPAMSALLGKQVDVLCDQTTQTIPHIDAKTVKFYGVTTKDRISKLPDAPTLHEQGLKDFDVKVWHGIYAPKGTPEAVITTFNTALKQALKTDAFKNKMADLGAEIVSEERQSPESLKAWVESEIKKWGPILQAEGMNVN
ncbi:MAG: tripartite tricarboxylate transporter substrate binding protein BugD [Alcaligenaceae bacterium]|nr:tripartite tricarboxylate transporter substrate binding protein BugD [Alcaligenaceae bacterium]